LIIFFGGVGGRGLVLVGLLLMLFGFSAFCCFWFAQRGSVSVCFGLVAACLF
jgi:hypothetical protein